MIREPYYDIDITCDCGNVFTWTAQQQERDERYYVSGVFSEFKQPKRCRGCRERKKDFYQRLEQHKQQTQHATNTK